MPFSSSARNLGFFITDNANKGLHVNHICRSAYAELRRISSIRHYLTLKATQTLISAFVLSKIDYCNSLLSGSPAHLLDKLQRLQNSAARIVFKAKKRDSATCLLESLHWLPVKARIEYKLSVLCHQYFSGYAPSYLSDILHVYVPSRDLRSSSDLRLLRVPRVNTMTFGQCSFSFAAPTVWNALPKELRHIQFTSDFKTALKIHLFKLYFPQSFSC